jgi:TfoX/Sxy family transcriptional regulator of competence genes
MAFDERTVERVRAAFGRYKNVSEIKMFGGICFTLNGNMCVGTLKDDLVVRVDPDLYQTLLARPHARPMNFTGRTMKGFLFVAPRGYRTDAALRGWVETSAAWVSTLPPKAKRGAKRPAARKKPGVSARGGPRSPRRRPARPGGASSGSRARRRA